MAIWPARVNWAPAIWMCMSLSASFIESRRWLGDILSLSIGLVEVNHTMMCFEWCVFSLGQAPGCTGCAIVSTCNCFSLGVNAVTTAEYNQGIWFVVLGVI
jgi:hypothetical protein